MFFALAGSFTCGGHGEEIQTYLLSQTESGETVYDGTRVSLLTLSLAKKRVESFLLFCLALWTLTSAERLMFV